MSGYFYPKDRLPATRQEVLQAGWSEEVADMMLVISGSTQAYLDAHPPRQSLEYETELKKIASQYDAKFPLRYVGDNRIELSRADTAIGYILKGSIYPVNLENDIWFVAGHTCSKRNNHCTCKDNAYEADGYGRLCAHRLAVIFKTNCKGLRNERLVNAISAVAEQTRGVNGRYFDLLVTREYIYERHADGELPTLAGYWTFGMHEHFRVAPKEEIPFTIPHFQSALQELGLSLMQEPIKLDGWTDYYYRVQLDTNGLAMTDSVFQLRGRTWRMEDRERDRRAFLLMLSLEVATAEHPEDYFNGPLKINLGEYETRRFVDVFQQVKNSRLARADWAAMSEAEKLASLENDIKWD